MADLYGALGVDAAASAAEIRRAYRKQAKRAHPDTAEGSAAKFAALTRALDVLSDPVRRRRYDETGEVEERVPDNQDAEALNLIAALLDTVANAAMQNGGDLSRFDLCAEVGKALTQRVAGCREQRKAVERVAAAWERAAERFEAREEGHFNQMAAVALGKAAMARQIMAQCDREVEKCARASAIVAAHRYRTETPQPHAGMTPFQQVWQRQQGGMW